MAHLGWQFRNYVHCVADMHPSVIYNISPQAPIVL